MFFLFVHSLNHHQVSPCCVPACARRLGTKAWTLPVKGVSNSPLLSWCDIGAWQVVVEVNAGRRGIPTQLMGSKSKVKTVEIKSRAGSLLEGECSSWRREHAQGTDQGTLVQ